MVIYTFIYCILIMNKTQLQSVFNANLSELIVMIKNHFYSLFGSISPVLDKFTDTYLAYNNFQQIKVANKYINIIDTKGTLSVMLSLVNR